MINFKSILYRIVAEFLFLCHVAVAIVLFTFWYFSYLYPFYLIVLIVSLLSDIIFHSCFLSVWEFYFRKKSNPNINYEHTFFSFYFNKFFGQKVSTRTVQKIVLVLLWVSLVLNIIYWIIKMA